MSFRNIKNLFLGIVYRLKKITNNRYQNLGLSILQVIYIKHLTRDKLRFANVNGHKFYFINGFEFIYGLTEIFINEIYKLKLDKDAYIIDCGSHIGLSVVYLKSLFPSAKILAFEPDSQNYSILLKNIESFKLNDVDALQKCVWIEDGHINFLSDSDMSCRIIDDNNKYSDSEIQEVESVRLKKYLYKTVDFLKIDIEGAEYFVLKDIQDSLENVKNIFLEYHGFLSKSHELSEILNILIKNNFEYYISSANEIYKTPFLRNKNGKHEYDLQLNIFAFKSIKN